MDPDKTLQIVKFAVQELPIKEAYSDALQPAARETGQALGRVASLLNSVLRPLVVLQTGWDILFGKIEASLRHSLEGTPEDQIIAPPPTVAAGIITGLLFGGDQEPDLRELFVRLLATSMVAETQNLAHPAFAEAIKQMTPTEAQIVSQLDSASAMPYLLIRGHVKVEGRTYEHMKYPASDLPDDEVRAIFSRHRDHIGGWELERGITYLDTSSSDKRKGPFIASFQNLTRLGILSISETTLL